MTAKKSAEFSADFDHIYTINVVETNNWLLAIIYLSEFDKTETFHLTDVTQF